MSTGLFALRRWACSYCSVDQLWKAHGDDSCIIRETITFGFTEDHLNFWPTSGLQSQRLLISGCRELGFLLLREKDRERDGARAVVAEGSLSSTSSTTPIAGLLAFASSCNACEHVLFHFKFWWWLCKQCWCNCILRGWRCGDTSVGLVSLFFLILLGYIVSGIYNFWYKKGMGVWVYFCFWYQLDLYAIQKSL